MHTAAEERRRAFAWWIRTGRLRPPHGPDGLELKFNPYRDPHDGRFTSASAGGATGSGAAPHTRTTSPKIGSTNAHLAGAEGGPVTARGANIRAFEEPMTLEQVFPGLHNAPGGAIVSAADSMLNLTGPANEMQAEVLRNTSTRLQEQIKAIDPTWHYDSLGPITTVEGLSNEVNDLRFEQAAVIARVKGDYAPLQVETARFIQQRTDDAYDDALALQKAGRLRSRLSDQEALGNYVDRDVREQLRERYNMLGIAYSAGGPVRVNSREYDSSGGDVTYRIPDSRVGDVAFDVTLTRKTLGSAQVRGFFNADFRPSRVVIIRPSQLGANHTYAIARPEIRR